MDLRTRDQLSRLQRWRTTVARRVHQARGLPSLMGRRAAPLATGDWPVLQLEHRVGLVSTDRDPRLEEGKRVNVALAAPCFDGLALGPDAPLSFWTQLGHIRRERGFVAGRELRGGCVVPALGGGICLLANALYEVGVRLGWVVLQRAGHTMEAIPSTAEVWGLDATVSWPQVDLRMQPGRPVRLQVFIEGDELVLQVRGTVDAPEVRVWGVADEVTVEGGVRFRQNVVLRQVGNRTEVLARNRKRLVEGEHIERSCLSCGETACASREADLDRVVG